MNAHEYPLPRQRLYVVGCTELLPSNIAYSLGLETSAFITASEFLRTVPELATGCLLVAGELPDGTGLGLHREVASRALDLTTVMLLDIENVQMCREAFHSGVYDCVSRNSAADEWLAILRAALQQNLNVIPNRRKRRNRRTRIDNLTSRELDVARLLSHGHALKEVGATLQISVQTASKHRSSIFTKMDVANQVELHQAFEDCIDLIEQAKS